MLLSVTQPSTTVICEPSVTTGAVVCHSAKYNKESSRKKKARRPKKPSTSSEESDDSSDDDSDTDDSDESANLKGRRHKVSKHFYCFCIPDLISIFFSMYIEHKLSYDLYSKSVFYF